MAESKYRSIITEDEAKECLGLDSDYSSSRIRSLIQEGSEYLKQKTGHDWSVDNPVNPIAKGAVEDYITQRWFAENDTIDKHVDKRLQDRILTLQIIADSLGENR